VGNKRNLIVGCPNLNDVIITEDQDFLNNLTPLTMLMNGMGWDPNNIFTFLLPTAIPTYCEVV